MYMHILCTEHINIKYAPSSITLKEKRTFFPVIVCSSRVGSRYQIKNNLISESSWSCNIYEKRIIKLRNIKLENVGKIILAQKFIQMNKFKLFKNERCFLLPDQFNKNTYKFWETSFV